MTWRYEHTIANPRLIEITPEHVTLRKRLALINCHEGVFVHFETEPPSTAGERELGFGAGATISFSSAGVSGRHPELLRPGMDLELLGQSIGPWWGWFASMAVLVGAGLALGVVTPEERRSVIWVLRERRRLSTKKPIEPPSV